MAKKFTFRLDPILRIRSYKVTLAKDELIQIVKKRNEKEDLINKKEEYYNNLISHKPNSGKALDMQAIISHQDKIKEEIKKLKYEKTQLQEIENYKRAKLTDAMKQEKVLEKLKEKKKEIHNSELSKEETSILDDIGRIAQSKIQKF